MPCDLLIPDVFVLVPVLPHDLAYLATPPLTAPLGAPVSTQSVVALSLRLASSAPLCSGKVKATGKIGIARAHEQFVTLGQFFCFSVAQRFSACGAV